MKQQSKDVRRAAHLLFAAAALPFTPLLAQTTEVPAPEIVAPPPAAELPPPTAPEATPPLAMEPVVNTEPSGNEPADSTASETAPPPQSRARVSSTAPKAKAPAIVPDAPATVPVEASAVPVPEAVTPTPAPLPEPAPPPATVPAQMPERPLFFWPWLAGAAVLIGALAWLFLFRRRRRASGEFLLGEEVVSPQPSVPASTIELPAATPAAFEADERAEPMVGVPAAAAAPVATAAITPAAFEAGERSEPVSAGAPAEAVSGRPAIDLLMRPVRAGVDQADARVEFELIIDNKGSAPARDVRISTWMLSAASAEGADMEQMLIEHPDSARVAEIDPGRAELIESAVAVAKDRIDGDAVLPVVVAEARYRLEDGTEQRSSARFAVGVPLEGELAHFDVANPSGMHENVEARPLAEFERA